MKEGVALRFLCVKCNEEYLILSPLESASCFSCSHCRAEYHFDEQEKGKTLRLFRDLCHQIRLSKDVLGAMNVSVSVGEHSVEVPFNLLFLRFPLRLVLNVGEEKFCIECIYDALRKEPLVREVLPKVSSKLESVGF